MKFALPPRPSPLSPQNDPVLPPGEMNEHLSIRGRSSSIGQVVLAFIAWSALPSEGGTELSNFLLLALLGTNVARILLTRGFLNGAPVVWHRTYTLLTLTTAALWSGIACYWVKHAGLSNDVDDILMILCAGIAAAGSSALSPDRRLARAFAVTLLAPIAGVLGFGLPEHHWSLAGVCGAYLWLLWRLINMQGAFLVNLHEQRDRFRALTDASMEATLIHIDGEIIEVNPAFTRLYGRKPEEVLGTSMLFLVPEEDRAAVASAISEARATSYVGRGLRADGTTFPIEAIGKSFIYRGRMARVTCIQDLTDRRQAEEAIQESARQAQLGLEARERAALDAAKVKSEFLANMSHEIRTPLNAIIGLTDLLKDLTVTEKQRHYLRTMKDSGEALLGLVNDILDYSKLENGSVELESLTFEINAVVDGQLSLLANRALQKGVSLRAFVDPHLPEKVRGDHARVGQILLNLLTNAIKFTERGAVSVRVTGARQNGTQLFTRFEVQDSGLGISQEAATRLFRPFTQANSSTARKHGGTGLGLSICKKLVEAMGGTIGFTSEEGRGSVFWFEIPLEVASERTILDTFDRSAVAVKRVGVDQMGLPSGDVVLAYLRAWDVPTVTIGPRLAPEHDCDLIIASRDRARALRAQLGENSPRFVAIVDSLDERALPAHQSASVEIPELHAPLRPSDLFNVIQDAGRKAARPAPAADTATSLPIVSTGRSVQVLVAEDNSTNQLIILALLRQMGLSCNAVSNGAEAVEAFLGGTYDLILMDCQMPEMDGYEATQRIRALESGTSRIPIIALTANVFKEDRERCFSVGMDDFLSKPVRREKLVAALKQFLDSKLAA